jgi:hypothetical protein
VYLNLTEGGLVSMRKLVAQRMKKDKLKNIIESLKMFFDDVQDDFAEIEGIRQQLVACGGSSGPTVLPILKEHNVISIINNSRSTPGCFKKAGDAVLCKEKLYIFDKFVDEQEGNYVEVGKVSRQVSPSKRTKGKMVTK